MKAARIRDAFFRAVAEKLEVRVARARALAKKAGRAGASRGAREALATAMDELASFARELRILAEPERPIPLVLRRLDLVAFFAALVAGHRARLAANGVALDLTQDGAAWGRFDAVHLEAIVAELVGNAMKYGRGRPVTLSLRMHGRAVALEVENHGAWIGRRGAVGRFVRGGGARGEGYGVGVWLTRRIATAHGGTLRFAHAPGKTTAIVVLPVTRVRGEVSLVARFTPRRPAPRGSPR